MPVNNNRMLPSTHSNPYTLTLIDTPSLTLDLWQFLMAPLINHYKPTSMCASYTRRGRITEFVSVDVAPAQQPPCQDPFLPWHTLCFIISLTQFPGIYSGQREAMNQNRDGDGPRGCKALWPTSNHPPKPATHCHAGNTDTDKSKEKTYNLERGKIPPVKGRKKRVPVLLTKCIVPHSYTQICAQTVRMDFLCTNPGFMNVF